MSDNGVVDRPIQPRFRMQAKHFALTYSNVEAQGWTQFDCNDLKTFLQQLGCTYVLVSKETHRDGTPHFHALASFEDKKNVQNSRFFDFCNVHPNIQKVKSVAKWKRYCKKEGVFVEHGVKELGMYAMCEASDEQEWVEYCIRKKVPFGYMEKIWKALHPSISIATIEYYRGGGQMCPDIAFFRYEDFSGKVLVLEGPTGCGKTTWAMKYAPKPTIVITHLDMLRKEFNPLFHKSVIFDDMSFSHLPREGQLHICEQRSPAQIHVRYGVACLPIGFPKIFTCNIYPFSRDPAIDRRIHHKMIIMPESPVWVTAEEDDGGYESENINE